MCLANALAYAFSRQILVHFDRFAILIVFFWTALAMVGCGAMHTDTPGNQFGFEISCRDWDSEGRVQILVSMFGFEF